MAGMYQSHSDVDKVHLLDTAIVVSEGLETMPTAGR